MSQQPRISAWPTVLVRTAATWILAGALFKLLVGSPNDLPTSVREFSADAFGFSAVLTYQLAIAIELSIAAFAWLRPDRAWTMAAAQLAVFCAVLTPLALAGAKSCGCFGSKIPVPPWAMLSIDGVLLAALLASRPWRATTPPSARWIPLAICVACAWAAPFGSTSSGAKDGGAARLADVDKTAELPRFVEWRPDDWVGERLSGTGVGRFVAVENHLLDANWVIYSPSCEHCAAYLRRLDGEFATDPRAYVFLRLPMDQGAERVVDVMPPGDEVELPSDVQYVITPPWNLRIDDGVVSEALHPLE